MKQDYKKHIDNLVRELYWDKDFNCAITTLTVLSDIYDIRIEGQVFHGATGLNGAGKFQAQCGIIEGVLIFLGILGTKRGYNANQIENTCYEFASLFEKEFSSLKCRELRPEGFNENNPPHLCEDLTKKGLIFTKGYIDNLINNGF
jgi:hypothetical protein